jgi:hypothetical protein
MLIRFKAAVAAAVLGLSYLPAVAYAQLFTSSDDDEKKPLLEIETKAPTFPKPSNLIPFAVSSASDNRFYIDPESIAVGADGVVRYTLVVKTPGGAENISYEGMRCDTREQKIYAIGHRDGTWVGARTSEWRRIEYKDINRQHGVLFTDFFCFDQPRPVRSAREAVDRFKYGIRSRGGP